MSDVSLASLAIEVDSTPVPSGVARLDDLADAGGRAEGSMQRLKATSEVLASETRKLDGATRTSVQSHTAATGVLVAEADAARKAANAYATFYDTAQHDFAAQYARSMGVATKATKLQAHGRPHQRQAGASEEVWPTDRELRDAGPG